MTDVHVNENKKSKSSAVCVFPYRYVISQSSNIVGEPSNRGKSPSLSVYVVCRSIYIHTGPPS